jgi:hypothetical protein
MRGSIRHKDGRVFDLWLGLTREEYAELEGSQGQSHARDPMWFCGGCGAGLFIAHGKRNRDQLFGYHFVADTSCKRIAINTMTEEHKREIEHHVLVGEHMGYSMATEVAISSRRRADVVADGRVAIEVQHSQESAGAATRRARASLAGAIEQVAWCTDLPGHMDPRWLGKVPGYRLMEGPYDWSKATPPPRSVKVAGVWNMVSDIHPHKRGVWVPKLEAISPLVDDVLAGMLDGSIKSVVYGKKVQLMTAKGVALHEELTGRQLSFYPAGKISCPALRSAQRIDCFRPPAAVLPAPDVVTTCVWCRQSLSEEAVRFRLTIHPWCADERAAMVIQHRYSGKISTYEPAQPDELNGSL